MNDGTDQRATVIAAHLREWEPAPAYVELAVFDSDDARVIATTLDAFYMRHLGTSIARGLFHQSSIGSVAGIVLRDGRAIATKGASARAFARSAAEVA
ncbi:MAG TPA: hypothetical protein VKX28_23675 [Xanthobacteraceae bacterium]|nr:hypothetical protein [Xanthobacteraceae bacterium]